MPKRRNVSMDNTTDRINKILYTSCLSAFINAISSLEEEFGFLWGEDKDPDQPLTPEEEAMFQRFIKWRKRVLDFGHLQIREGQSRVIILTGKRYDKK